MGKFTWRRKSDKKGLLRDEESADISIAPISPYLDTDHSTERSLHQANSGASFDASSTSLEHQDLLSCNKRLGVPGFRNSIGISSSLPEPAAQNANNTASVNDTKTPVAAASPSVTKLLVTSSSITSPSVTSPNLASPLLSIHTTLPNTENRSEYEEDESPEDFVERRLGHSSILSSRISRLTDFDDYLFYRVQSQVPRNHDEESPAESNDKDLPSSKGQSTCLGRTKQNRFYIITLIACVYTAASSAFWFLLGGGQVSYKRVIHSGDHSLLTITTLVSLNSKLTEVLFLGVFGLAIGQVFSRIAISPKSRGIDLSALSIRLWITRPGAFFTHFAAVPHAFRAWPFFSAFSFMTAIMGLSYTSASNALVLPRLANTNPTPATLYGLVQSSYANPTYIQQTCQTPITQAEDSANGGSTCVAMEQVGQAYYSYLRYTHAWAQVVTSGQAPVEMLDRPPITGQLSGNTSVQGSWIETQYSDNIQSLFSQYGRVVNNVTVAMPHSGVIAAAKDKKNSMLQPHNLGVADQYTIQAAVPSPALNVLCANADLDEIAPLVYTQWPNAETVGSDIPGWTTPESPFWWEQIPAYSDDEWLNNTALDDVFGWGEKYDRKPPIFEALPIQYNTVANTSMYYGDSTYILMRSNFTSQTGRISPYTICSMRTFLYSNCATEYNVAGAFASLKAHCDDPKEKFAYNNSVPDAPITISHDYPNVASGWALAVSLNDGVVAGNASNARLLTEFALQEPSLDPKLPSTAEAIAALAGYTLLLSMLDSPFVHYWQYNTSILDQGVYQPFNASVVVAQYFSTASEIWQYIFIIPLFWVFCATIITFAYLATHPLVTDYTEADNLFALGVASPEDELLVEHCAHDHEEGPEDHVLRIPFWIAKQDEGGRSYITGQKPKVEKKARSDEDLEQGLSRRASQSSHSSQAAQKDGNGGSDEGFGLGLLRRATQKSVSRLTAKKEEGVNGGEDIEMRLMSRLRTMNSISIEAQKEAEEFV